MVISKLFYIDDNIIIIHLRYPLRFTHYVSHSVYPYMQPIEEQFPKRKFVVLLVGCRLRGGKSIATARCLRTS